MFFNIISDSASKQEEDSVFSPDKNQGNIEDDPKEYCENILNDLIRKCTNEVDIDITHHQIQTTGNLNVELPTPSAINQLSRWQQKLILMSTEVNDALVRALHNIFAMAEELESEVVEGKSGNTESLLEAWLMTIRLTVGQIKLPPGNNNTISLEVWRTLSELGEATVDCLKHHKNYLKSYPPQLESTHERILQYVPWILKPASNLKIKSSIVDRNIREMNPGHSAVPGSCSISVVVLERDVFLVHDEDKQAPILHFKESPTTDYSKHVEVLKIFIENVTSLLNRSKASTISRKPHLDLIMSVIQRKGDELLKHLQICKQADRLKDKLISPAFRKSIIEIDKNINNFVDHIEEIKLMYTWVLTAVEACFNKIKKSWSNINLESESLYRQMYKNFQNQSPWWHPKRFFTKKCTFWDDVIDDVGRFEKMYLEWSQDEMHLINLQTSISDGLATLLFAEPGGLGFPFRQETTTTTELVALDSPTSVQSNEPKATMDSYYSDIFIIEAPVTRPNKGRRHHLSQVDMDVEDHEVSLPPVLEHSIIFQCENTNDQPTPTDMRSSVASLSPTVSLFSGPAASPSPTIISPASVSLSQDLSDDNT